MLSLSRNIGMQLLIELKIELRKIRKLILSIEIKYSSLEAHILSGLKIKEKSDY